MCGPSITSSSTRDRERRGPEPRQGLGRPPRRRCPSRRAVDAHRVRRLVHLGVEPAPGDVHHVPRGPSAVTRATSIALGDAGGERADRAVERADADRRRRSRRRCPEGRTARRRRRPHQPVRRQARPSRRHRGRPPPRPLLAGTSSPFGEVLRRRCSARRGGSTPASRSEPSTRPISRPALPPPAVGFATTTTGPSGTRVTRVGAARRRRAPGRPPSGRRRRRAPRSTSGTPRRAGHRRPAASSTARSPIAFDDVRVLDVSRGRQQQGAACR